MTYKNMTFSVFFGVVSLMGCPVRWWRGVGQGEWVHAECRIMYTQILHTDSEPSPGFNSHFFAQFSKVSGFNIWNTPCEVVRRGEDKAVEFGRKGGRTLSDVDLNIHTCGWWHQIGEYHLCSSRYMMI